MSNMPHDRFDKTLSLIHCLCVCVFEMKKRPTAQGCVRQKQIISNRHLQMYRNEQQNINGYIVNLATAAAASGYICIRLTDVGNSMTLNSD